MALQIYQTVLELFTRTKGILNKVLEMLRGVVVLSGLHTSGTKIKASFDQMIWSSFFR
jgi:hypothetical protein